MKTVRPTAIARQNPIGMRSEGHELVRVGDGKQVHVLNDAGNGILCGSAKGKREKEIALYKVQGEFITCWRCVKMVKGSALAGTTLEDTWGRQLSELSEKLPGGQLREFAPSREKNRPEHRQVVGGRESVRWPQGGQVEAAAPTIQRLLETDQLPGIRTQSPEVVKATAERSSAEDRLADKIRQAISRYSADASFFLVPSSAHTLILAGMPTEAAHILVERHVGREFSDPPKFKGLPTLLDVFRVGLRSPVRMRGFEMIVKVSQGPYVVSQVRVETGDEETGTDERLFSSSSVEEEHDRWRREAQAKRRELDDSAFLTFFWAHQERRLLSMVDPASAKEPRLVVMLRGRDKKRVERTLSLREHSKFMQAASEKLPIEYRSLDRVSLRGLPNLLARLCLRRRREGRKLPQLRPITRPNPSMSDFSDIETTSLPPAPVTQDALVSLFVDSSGKMKPDAQPVPVPGKPGRYYWYSQTKRQVVETTLSRIRAWQAAGARAKAAFGSSKQQPLVQSNPRSRVEQPMARRRSLFSFLSRPTRAQKLEARALKAEQRPRHAPADHRPQARPGAPEFHPAAEHRLHPYPLDDDHGPFAHRIAAFGPQRFVPVNRRNPKKAGAKKSVSPKVAAWRETFGRIVGRARQIMEQRAGISYKQAFAIARAEIVGGGGVMANPAPRLSLAEARRFGYTIGAFGPGGTHPLGRRNPAGDAMAARFPGCCCRCGEDYDRGEMICDSGVRGPKGGKKMAHVNCGR